MRRRRRRRRKQTTGAQNGEVEQEKTRQNKRQNIWGRKNAMRTIEEIGKESAESAQRI